MEHEEEFTVSFTPSRYCGGTRPSEPVEFPRKNELFGAALRYGDTDFEQHHREKTWSSCTTAMTKLSSAISSLDVSLRRVLSVETPNAPSIVTDTMIEDAFKDTMQSEGEAMSGLMLPWLEDLCSRVDVLVTYETTRRTNRMHNLAQRQTQTDETTKMIEDGLHRRVGEEGRKGPIDDPGDVERKSIFDLSLMDTTANEIFQKSSTRPRFNGNTCFSYYSSLSVSAMRIQTVFRGYKARNCVGNFKKKWYTWFHCKNPFIVDLWIRTERTYGSHERRKRCHSTMWLISSCTSLLLGKVIADYLSKSLTDEPMSFSRYLVNHYQASTPDANEPEGGLSTFLLTLGDAAYDDTDDAFLQLMFSLVLGQYSWYQECVLGKLALPLAAVLANAVDTMTIQYISLDMEIERELNLPQMKHILQKVFVAISATKVLNKILEHDALKLPEAVAHSKMKDRKVSHKQFMLLVIEVCGSVDMSGSLVFK